MRLLLISLLCAGCSSSSHFDPQSYVTGSAPF